MTPIAYADSSLLTRVSILIPSKSAVQIRRSHITTTCAGGAWATRVLASTQRTHDAVTSLLPSHTHRRMEAKARIRPNTRRKTPSPRPSGIPHDPRGLWLVPGPELNLAHCQLVRALLGLRSFWFILTDTLTPGIWPHLVSRWIDGRTRCSSHRSSHPRFYRRPSI